METTFETKEQFTSFVAAWKEYVNSDKKHNLQSYHFALYRMLRCRDWELCFAPTERISHYPGMTAKQWSLRMIKNARYDEGLLAPFGNTVTSEQLVKLREQL